MQLSIRQRIYKYVIVAKVVFYYWIQHLLNHKWQLIWGLASIIYVLGSLNALKDYIIEPVPPLWNGLAAACLIYYLWQFRRKPFTCLNKLKLGWLFKIKFIVGSILFYLMVADQTASLLVVNAHYVLNETQQIYFAKITQHVSKPHRKGDGVRYTLHIHSAEFGKESLRVNADFYQKSFEATHLQLTRHRSVLGDYLIKREFVLLNR